MRSDAKTVQRPAGRNEKGSLAGSSESGRYGSQRCLELGPAEAGNRSGAPGNEQRETGITKRVPAAEPEPCFILISFRKSSKFIKELFSIIIFIYFNYY